METSRKKTLQDPASFGDLYVKVEVGSSVEAPGCDKLPTGTAVFSPSQQWWQFFWDFAAGCLSTDPHWNATGVNGGLQLTSNYVSLDMVVVRKDGDFPLDWSHTNSFSHASSDSPLPTFGCLFQQLQCRPGPDLTDLRLRPGKRDRCGETLWKVALLIQQTTSKQMKSSGN